jgi:hypothetical protein
MEQCNGSDQTVQFRTGGSVSFFPEPDPCLGRLPLTPMGRGVARPGPPAGQRGQPGMPVFRRQIQGPARFSQPFGQPFRPPVQPHQGCQTDGFLLGRGSRILFPGLDESVTPGHGFRGQRLRKGPVGEFLKNGFSCFPLNRHGHGRQPLPAASSGVMAIIRWVRQKFQR